MIRVLQIARSSAVKQHTQAINSMRGLIVTAPSELREALRGLSVPRVVAACCLLRPGELATPTAAVKFALRGLGRRHRDLTKEIKTLDAELAPLTGKVAPALTKLFGVGTQVAGSCWSPPGTTPAACTPRQALPRSAASRRSRPPQARHGVIASTAAATARPTPPCIAS